MPPRARPRVLITGATGFLGRAFLERFADRYEFLALARTPRDRGVGARVDWLQADLREPLPLKALPKRVHAIAHLASLRTPSPERDEGELFAVNAGSVAALLEYARTVAARSFVLGSTGGVCGYHRGVISEATPPAPFDAYTLSKWHGETIARHQACAGAVPVTIVRYFFPYGPSQRTGIIPRLADLVQAGRPVTILAAGRHPRINPVFVDDACELTRLAVDAGKSVTVNCAGPQAASIKEIAAMIGEMRGIAPRFRPARQAGISNMVASTLGARRTFGFRPRVGLRTGLAALLDAQ